MQATMKVAPTGTGMGPHVTGRKRSTCIVVANRANLEFILVVKIVNLMRFAPYLKQVVFLIWDQN